MDEWNLYTLAAGKIHYLPISPLETVWFNDGGITKDYTIPDVLLQMVIQNAFLICEWQGGSALQPAVAE